MKTVKDEKLFSLFREYFTEYLPKQQKRSANTVRSYQGAIELLLEFIKTQNHIRITDITLSMFDRKMITNFLTWLETERGASLATRNNRLACIHSFFSFAADADPTLIALAEEMRKVKMVKDKDKKPLEHLSENAVKVILAEPDARTEKGLRDRLLVTILYDTGARIQEVLNIRLNDLHLKGTPTVTVHGKGNKTRHINLMDVTKKHIENYMRIFHPGKDFYSDDYLFYVRRVDGNKRMTEDNARRLVRTYGKSAKKTCPEIPDDIHPHLFRHTRAMHLYKHGMPLSIISQWLGHSDIETTLIYANADTEMKRKAIEAATPADSPLRQFVNAERYTVNDEDIVKRLWGLK